MINGKTCMRIFLLLSLWAMCRVVGSDPSSSSDFSSDGSTTDDGSDTSSNASNTTTAVTTNAPAFVVTPATLDSASVTLATKWTASGVNGTLGQNTESTSLDRFNLQKQLTLATPGKVSSLKDLSGQEDQALTVVNVFAGNVSNITSILTADSSAGGIASTTKELMNTLPLTQQFLSTTMNQQLQNAQNDALVIRQSLNQAETDYRNQIQASADTVSSIIAQNDKIQARLAASQAKAAAQSAALLQSVSTQTVNTLSTQANTQVAAANTSATTAANGVSTAGVALSDASDMLGDIPTQYKQSVGDVSSGVNDDINNATAASIAKVQQSADDALSTTESYAADIGNQMAKNITSLDQTTTSTLGNVITSVKSNATSISRTVQQTNSQNTNALNQNVRNVNSQIGSVATDSTTATSDVLQVAQDSQSMLTQQQTMASTLFSNFGIDIGKLGNMVTGQVGGISTSAQAVAGSVNGDSSNELVSQNNAIAYLMQLVSNQNSQIGGNSQQQLLAVQQSQAKTLSDRQGSISSTQSDLQSQLNGVAQAGTQKAANLGNSVGAISGTYSGSISDLMSTVADTASGASDGLSSLQDNLSKQAGGGFQSLLESLRAANSDAGAGESNFMNSIIGPANDQANSQFGSMRDLLTALLSAQGSQSSDQNTALQTLSGLQGNFNAQVNNASQSMNSAFSMNTQYGKSIGSAGDSMIANGKQLFLKMLYDQLGSAKSSSQDGFTSIDQLINQMSINNGGPNSAVANISQTLSGTGANLDISSSQLSDAQKAQLQAMAGLGSLSISVLNQNSNQAIQDKSAAQAALADAKANIMAQFQTLAGNATDNQLSSLLAQLAQSGNNSALVSALMANVTTALKQIESDAATAQTTNNQQKSQFSVYVSDTSSKLKSDQVGLQNQLAGLVSAVEDELSNKTQYLAQTGASMNQSLTNITNQVYTAQQNLVQNLALYETKLEDIINQIRAYMNMSGDADELAIQNDISQQLQKVNSTQVSVAAANAQVAGKIQAHNDSATGQFGAQSDIIAGVISGAVSTESSLSDSHIAHNQNLAAVAMNVDGASSQLDNAVTDGSSEISNGIVSSSANAANGIASGESNQAVAIGQINARAGDVANEARGNFINNLERMGGVDDSTLMVTKQLGELLSNSNSSITDVSAATMSHMNLSVQTMADLNSAQATQVASVSDVMGAFTAVLTGFLNETESVMSNVMSEISAVDSESQQKLQQINVRSSDANNWVGGNLNKTADNFNQFIEQANAIQEAMGSGITDATAALKMDDTNYAGEASNIDDSVNQLQQSITAANNQEMDHVRSWITKRDPAVAQAVLGTSSSTSSTGASTSFLESVSRSAIIRDITNRMEIVKDDLKRLRGTA